MTETRRINLSGKEIAYTFKRSRRKSIGLKIDSGGLIVNAPLSGSLHGIESVLRDKADWVIKKLDQWKNRKSTQLIWAEGANFPLLGKPWQFTMVASDVIQMTPGKLEARMAKIESSELTAEQIERVVMAWYYRQAFSCFTERVTFYANKLNVELPSLRLSRAKTRWGSCNTRGVIHLNWRLIQMPLNLVDYVVAHELSHLIEMNHSPAFWQLVGRIYPDYLAARKELKKFW
ncbi:MAG: SprT family zinc-dependent metalloprotease [Nitrosomonas sp.]|nr:SprT family zinc-dependent metalloprotease [Nitrosomonas sp.]MDP1951163.1 SprT family zinc-dependent metalloprotease [Nitrosomonas sp.]